MPFPRHAGACLLAASLFSASIVAPGHAATPAEQEQAQKIFTEAKDLYKRGQYRAAIQKLEDARRLDPGAKELPYNLGTVHEKVGDLEKAIQYFELYLTLEKEESERDRVRQIIKRLEGAVADAKRNRPPPAASSSAPEKPKKRDDDPPPPTETTPGPRKLTKPVIALGAVSAATLLAGAYFGLKALGSQPKDAKTGNGTSIRDLDDDADATKSNARKADLFVAVSLLTGGAAAYLYWKQERPPVTGSAVVLPGGAATRWEVRF